MPPRRRTSKDTPRKLAGRMKRPLARCPAALRRDSRDGRGTPMQAAKAAAEIQFDLDEVRRQRIMVQELA